MTRFEDGVTRSPCDAPEKWVLGGGIETPLHIKYMEQSRKKLKAFLFL